jgi:hypothetical protein
MVEALKAVWNANQGAGLTIRFSRNPKSSDYGVEKVGYHIQRRTIIG